MDLRTKLVFALVSVSLVGMAVLGTLAYTNAEELLTRKTLRQLNSLAEAKKDDLETAVSGWKDRVSLIASRTQLRLTLREYDSSRLPEHRERIERILSDALGSSRAVQSLVIYDVEGRPVAWVRRDTEPALVEPATSRLPGVGDTVGLPAIFFTSEGEPRASFVTPLAVEGEPVGALLVQLNAQELIDLARSVIGLGATGETMIVLRDTAGVTRVLHPLRESASEVPRVVLLQNPDAPAERSLRGEEGPFVQGLIDYRGEPVWAATRFIAEVGWGVVVKFDAAEERAPILEFRRRLAQLGLSLSAFAILLGVLLGLRMAKPIHDLAGVANRIRIGELDARAEVKREDELGLLARTFNQMADELERQMTLLQEFQKYFELSLDMLCIAGTDGFFKRVNPAFERTLGWSTEELLGRPFIDFVHPDDVEKTAHEINKLSHGIPTVSFENCYGCADGTWKQLMWTAHPEPKTGLIYAIARDVTGVERGES